MPVQINEVIIKAVVDQQGNVQSSGASEISGAAVSEEALAEKILAMIKEKQER